MTEKDFITDALAYIGMGRRPQPKRHDFIQHRAERSVDHPQTLPQQNMMYASAPQIPPRQPQPRMS